MTQLVKQMRYYYSYYSSASASVRLFDVGRQPVSSSSPISSKNEKHF